MQLSAEVESRAWTHRALLHTARLPSTGRNRTKQFLHRQHQQQSLTVHPSAGSLILLELRLLLVQVL